MNDIEVWVECEGPTQDATVVINLSGAQLNLSLNEANTFGEMLSSAVTRAVTYRVLYKYLLEQDGKSIRQAQEFIDALRVKLGDAPEEEA